MKKVASGAMLTLLFVSLSAFGALELKTTPSGDAQYAWNSKYGPSGYTTGGTAMGVGLSMDSTYGNDYTVSIFEIPIAALVGKTLTSAMLEVDARGFDTSFYSSAWAQIGWLDTGTRVLTGDVVADALGSMSPRPSGYKIWDYWSLPDGAGLKSFDFTAQVQADVDAGRSYSTFVLNGSRDVYGSIATAESGSGPRLVAVVPEPATMMLLGIGGVTLLRRKK